MEPSRKMKSSILMQVRDAVPLSCPGALGTWVSNSWALVSCKLCPSSAKSKLVLSLLHIPPVFPLRAPFTNCLKSTGEGSSPLGLDTDLLKCPLDTSGVTKDFSIGTDTVWGFPVNDGRFPKGQAVGAAELHRRKVRQGMLHHQLRAFLHFVLSLDGYLQSPAEQGVCDNPWLWLESPWAGGPGREHHVLHKH